jgi:hypothetical protein
MGACWLQVAGRYVTVIYIDMDVPEAETASCWWLGRA